jgi:hypothetical protein
MASRRAATKSYRYRASAPAATALEFFSPLRWLDGRPLVIEPYRAEIFRCALDERDADGVPLVNSVLAGRAKKNCKTLDLILAALYCLLVRESPQGNDAFILANDEGQAADDLSLAKKLVQCNRDLAARLEILQKEKEIRRLDGRGSLRILPAQNATGQHGKTAIFVGFDEIHGYTNWDLIEALQPDPTRPDALTWITSYDTIFDSPGIPLHDLKALAKSGTEPRMLFSWYSADYTTDPAFADLPPEQRANPSMQSWPQGARYLDQQRRRLPSNRYKRLHLNMPGAPSGAFFDQGVIDGCVVRGRYQLDPQPGIDYLGFVDMSGGSSDDSVLAIGHLDGKKAVVDLVVSQAGAPPFDPRHAVARFSDYLKRYNCRRVIGDAYGGQTFRSDFASHGNGYEVCPRTTSQNYEELEVVLNSGNAELLDHAKTIQQLCTLTIRGAKIDHLPGQHDDHAAAVAGLIVSLAVPSMADQWISHYATLADRARAAAAAPPDEDEQPQAARRGSARPQVDDDGLPVEGADNSVHQAYLAQARATLSAMQNGRHPGPPGQVHAAVVCAHCSRPTGNTRQTDGVRSWCDRSCEAAWIRGRVERDREKRAALARSQGLPVAGLRG